VSYIQNTQAQRLLPLIAASSTGHSLRAVHFMPKP
jgi:hypothetical protein